MGAAGMAAARVAARVRRVYVEIAIARLLQLSRGGQARLGGRTPCRAALDWGENNRKLQRALEGFDGWAQAMSTRHDWNEVTGGLGSRYELAPRCCRDPTGGTRGPIEVAGRPSV